MLSKYLTILALTEGIQAVEKLIFEDNFDTLNMKTWQHEITMSGGGNWEFEYYTNNRTNSFVEDGVLFLQPTFTADKIGEDALENGSMNLYGSTPADECTSNQFFGCERSAGNGNIINPIQSARLRSIKSVNFKYGRAEIRAKMPKGDWIWPGIWMIPTDNAYGGWPASGEIDIVESRGNAANSASQSSGRDSFGSTLHYGPGWPLDAWSTGTAQYQHPTDLSDDFHNYGLEWTEEYIKTTIDGVEVLNFQFDEDMFTKGKFPSSMANPWKREKDLSAPFNQEMFLVFNVAVGGNNGYFADGSDKPWKNSDPNAAQEFWNARETWSKTWNYPETNDAAMKIDYVKIWQDDGTGKQDPTFLQ